MQDLIKEYRETLKLVRKLKETAPEEDKRILGSMDSDLRYCIQWMRTARRPGNRRGVERLAAYQREKSFDPIFIQQYFSGLDKYERASYMYDPYHILLDDKHNRLTQTEKEKIEDALSCLSRLERDIYLMARGRCIPREEIAHLMGVTKGTVNKILKRADDKIKKHIQNSLFCLPNAT
jgi:positive control factor